MGKSHKLVLIVMVLVSITGCWDRVEIEERGFVAGVGIELPEELQEENKEDKGKPKGKQRYALTYQFVIPAAVSPQSGGGGGMSGGKPFINLTSTGDSLFSITRQLATRTSRTPFLEHLMVILISEEVARKKGNFANAVDFFLRYNQTRRSTEVFIVEGSPTKALSLDPNTERLSVNYIESVSRNHIRTGRMLKPFHLGQLEQKLLAETSFAIPRIVVGKSDVKVAGAAVMHGKGNRLVGWLGEEETEGLNFLKNEMVGGVIEGQIEDNIIVFELRNSKRRIKVNDRDLDNIKFTFDIDVDGTIGESLETMDYMKLSNDLRAQRSIEKEIKRLCEETIQKLKDDFKVDAIELGEYLKHHRPETWEKVKKNWDSGKNYFSKSDIHLNVNVILRNPGVITESET